MNLPVTCFVLTLCNVILGARKFEAILWTGCRGYTDSSRRAFVFHSFNFHTSFLGILCGVSSFGIYSKQLMSVKALNFTGLAANIHLLLSSLIKERALNAPFLANLTSSVNSAGEPYRLWKENLVFQGDLR